MHLIIREGTTAELVEGMEHGEYDLALTLLSIDKRLFNYEAVLEEKLILAVPASHTPFPTKTVKGRKHPAVDAKILDGKSMVMLTDTQFMQKQLENLLLEKHMKVSVAAIVKSLEAQIEFVKAGVGMALMPSGIECFCKSGDMVFYSFEEPLPRCEVVVMC